jgi:hypothetical protein
MAYTTINKGSSYFNTVTYSGTGSNQTITVGFQPDFVWTKRRNASYSNELQDIVRGVTKVNYSDNTAAEDTVSQNIQSFNSTGYVQGSNPGVNESGGTYVSWNWLASNTTTSNTSGTISSTISVNQTAGFSVVGYTGNGTAGATVGHGLGTTPSMFIIKNRIDSISSFWCVYHKSAFVSQSDPNILYLNSTGAVSDDINVLGNSTVTINSTVFSLGDYNGSNGSGDAMIAYCFSEVKGYSKFGSYTGNGSTDGTFIYTGFKPAFIMVKVTDITNSWFILDNKRLGYNPTELFLNPNSNSAESGSTGAYVDFTSNGFKWRTTSNAFNGSSNNYIYAAFAENPFVSSTQIPTTAR